MSKHCPDRRLHRSSLPVLLLALGLLSACAQVVRRDAPTIAHIHIGHAITAWPAAPGKRGLLVVAELASVAAAAHAEALLETTRAGDLEESRHVLADLARAVDPTLLDPADVAAYGLRRAAAEAITHLTLASEVDDASANVQRTVTRTNVRARRIIDRADELGIYIAAGLKAQSIEELAILTEEIVRSLRVIAGGPEMRNSYGLYDFRQDIEAMVARENPPYHTVDSWYLFNLVQLPNGEWGFASRRSRGAAGVGY